MKVTSNELARTQATQTRVAENRIEGARFDDILRQTVSEKTAPQASVTQGLTGLTGPVPIDTATLLGLDSKGITDSTERLLNVLDEFQAKLADETIPLSDLSPLVQKMNTEKDLLTPALDSMSPSDPLRDVLNRVLITCSVEAQKFERGDYL